MVSERVCVLARVWLQGGMGLKRARAARARRLYPSKPLGHASMPTHAPTLTPPLPLKLGSCAPAPSK